jgi:GNAT superfamily N-acetyltransferase
MANIEPFGIDCLEKADVPAALALSAEAGWNQTEADWQLTLTQGQVFASRDYAGRPVATAAIVPYEGFAWISMVLVTSAWRHRGLATSLMRHCIQTLRSKGLVPFLDATPAGERVYLPLGFKPLFGISRWQGRGGCKETAEFPGADLASFLALDAAAFGARREALLRSFISRSPGLALQQGADGFVVARDGRLATQIGPLCAGNERTALRLLSAVLDRCTGSVFLDVPERWTALNELLRGRGFTIQRGFRRMALNSTRAFGDPARYFLVAGPEFG